MTLAMYASFVLLTLLEMITLSWSLQENLQAVQKFLDPLLGPIPSELSSNSFPEEEQADLYCCWAEAALFKHR